MADNMQRQAVHIDDIRAGDTVEIDGVLKTVCPADIKTGGFMGTTLFGDSFRSGTMAVVKVTFVLPGEQRAPVMSEDQIYFLTQSYSFRMGYADQRGGEQYDPKKNEEWQRGYKWAKAKLGLSPFA